MDRHSAVGVSGGGVRDVVLLVFPAWRMEASCEKVGDEHEAKTERARSQIAVYFSRESKKSMLKLSKIYRKGGRGTPVGTGNHDNARKSASGVILC